MKGNERRAGESEKLVEFVGWLSLELHVCMHNFISNFNTFPPNSFSVFEVELSS